jgi:FeS assembly SUF system regulator
MIRMTRHTDYGIVLLTRIAAGSLHAVHAARDLARETRLPVPTVSKILKALAREGLLASHRGVKGGYSLARAATQITMADIIAALEGPIAMTDCLGDPPGTCEHEPFCQVQQNWRRINKIVMKALSSVTLAEMTHPLPQSFVTLEVGAHAGSG